MSGEDSRRKSETERVIVTPAVSHTSSVTVGLIRFAREQQLLPTSFLCCLTWDWERDRHRLKRRDKEKGRQKAGSVEEGRKWKTYLYSHLMQDPYLLRGRRRWRIHGNACAHKAADWKKEGERETDRQMRYNGENQSSCHWQTAVIHLLWQRSCLISSHALWSKVVLAHTSACLLQLLLPKSFFELTSNVWTPHRWNKKEVCVCGVLLCVCVMGIQMLLWVAHMYYNTSPHFLFCCSTH